MAGLPASFGFVAKDVIATAKKLSQPFWIVGSATLFVSAIGVAVAAVATLRIFFGKPAGDAADAHDEGIRLALPPLVLAAAGILFGLVPGLLTDTVVAAARVIAPALRDVDADLSAQWAARLGSVATVLALGAVLYAGWDRLHAALERLHPLHRVGPAAAYDHALALLKKTSTRVTTTLQSGRTGAYLLLTAFGTVVLVAPWLLAAAPSLAVPGIHESDGPVLVGCAVILAGAVLVLAARDTLRQLLGSGVIGVGSAMLFLFRGAPDLALTQLAVETVFVIVAAVAILRYRGPRAHERTSPLRALTAASFGVLVGFMLLAITSRPAVTELADYFLANSVPAAHGHNVVNVIIVDFRGLDTLGEITVVMLAALAAVVLIERRGARSSS
jgi:multicomponent Na+:H+ antiporter subunit A